MNHKLWNSVAARVLAASFIIAGLGACGERLADTHAKSPSDNPANPSTVLVGTAPAQPTGDPPATSPVASNTSDVSKHEEVNNKPREGDQNSFSTVAPNSPQKSDGSDPQAQPDRKKD